MMNKCWWGVRSIMVTTKPPVFNVKLTFMWYVPYFNQDCVGSAAI